MRHLIISRINLHMDLDPWKYKDPQPYKREGWGQERIRLLNDWCRRSLRKQTNQNFVFITLWQKGHMQDGGELKDEIKIEIERTGAKDDEPLNYDALVNRKKGKLTLNYANQIADKVRDRFEGPAIVTNLDCDDALHHKFVEVLQGQSFPDSPYYYSSTERYCYSIKTGVKGVKTARSPSPFVSTWEPQIECYPLKYNHSYLHHWVEGKNINGLYGLQTVNGTNMFSEGTGKEIEFDLGDYV